MCDLSYARFFFTPKYYWQPGLVRLLYITMDGFVTLKQRWLEDMVEVGHILLSMFQGGSVPDIGKLQGLVLSTLVSTLLVSLLLSCTLKRGRTAILNVTESVLVIVLLVCLVAFVALLPLGALPKITLTSG